MKKGELFEKTVYIIEETLKKDSSCKVVHDVKLMDKDGNERQIDVLITYQPDDRHEFKVIVECKDWKNKVEIGHIGEFVDKLRSVDAQKGIYVTRKGFQKGAITKAEREGIILYTLNEINTDEIKNWLPTISCLSIIRIDQDFDLVNHYYLIPHEFTEKLLPLKNDINILYAKHDKSIPVKVVTNLLARHFLRRLVEPLYLEHNKGNKSILNQKHRIMFQYDFQDEFYLMTGGEKIPFLGLQLELDAWIFETEIKDFKMESLKDSEKIIADIVTVKHEDKLIKFTSTKNNLSVSLVSNDSSEKVKMFKQRGMIYYDDRLEDIFGDKKDDIE